MGAWQSEIRTLFEAFSKEVPVRVLFFFFPLSASPSLPLYLVALFFCHHRAYNSHFMSLTLLLVVCEKKTERTERVASSIFFMTPFLLTRRDDSRVSLFCRPKHTAALILSAVVLLSRAKTT